MTRASLIVLVPVFDDWSAVSQMLASLNAVLAEEGMEASVILVDDASPEPPPGGWLTAAEGGLRSVEVLTLRRNMGHQRAICVGLAYVESHIPCETVLVMDGDGEDDPADVPRLIGELRKNEGRVVVFARREERSEGAIFSLFYLAYRVVFRILTGQHIRVGNYSVLPASVLPRLTAISELWNHYASGVRKARVPTHEIATSRGRRLAGKSTMNFVSLVTHGLSAISVYSETVGVRLLLASLVVIVGAFAVLLVVVLIKIFTELAIPGWATAAGGILIIIVLQATMFSLFFAFIVLHGRNSPGFLPSRDYEYFVQSLTLVRGPS